MFVKRLRICGLHTVKRRRKRDDDDRAVRVSYNTPEYNCVVWEAMKKLIVKIFSKAWENLKAALSVKNSSRMTQARLMAYGIEITSCAIRV